MMMYPIGWVGNVDFTVDFLVALATWDATKTICGFVARRSFYFGKFQKVNVTHFISMQNRKSSSVMPAIGLPLAGVTATVRD